MSKNIHENFWDSIYGEWADFLKHPEIYEDALVLAQQVPVKIENKKEEFITEAA